MPKVKLIYDIADPDEAVALKRLLKADDMAFALHEMIYNTKKSFIWKVDAIEKEDKQDLYDQIDAIYERFWEILNDHNVNIEEILQ